MDKRGPPPCHPLNLSAKKFFKWKYVYALTSLVSTESLTVHLNLLGGGCARTGQETREVRPTDTPRVTGARLPQTGLTAKEKEFISNSDC